MHESPSFRDLYPTLTEDELKEAEQRLRRYAEIAMEVYFEQVSVGAVDSLAPLPTIKERSKKSLKN
jgi:D-serine dehydratase